MTLLRSNPVYNLELERDPFLPDQKFILLSSFYKLAELSSSDLGQKALVLLSSCHDHRATFNACAHDVEYAIKGMKNDVDTLLSRMEAAAYGNTDNMSQKSHQPTLIQTDDTDRFIGAITTKAGTFTQVAEIIQSALHQYIDKRDLFENQYMQLTQFMKDKFNGSVEGKLFWEQCIVKTQFLDNTRLSSIETKFYYLNICEQLSWYLQKGLRALLQLAGVKLKESQESAKDQLLKWVLEYNKITDEYKIHIGTHLRTKLDITGVLRTEDPLPIWRIMLPQFRQCYREIVELFEIYVPVYQEWGTERFLPKNDTKLNTTMAGYTEYSLREYYILCIDIIRSKLSTGDVKKLINNNFQRYRDKGVYVYNEPTGDDCFVVACPSWLLLLDVVHSSVSLVLPLSNYADQKKFGGLRSSSNYGALTIMEKRNSDNVVLIDGPGNPIALSAYINAKIEEALQRYDPKSNPNDWLILAIPLHSKLCSDNEDMSKIINFGTVSIKENKTAELFAMPLSLDFR